MFLKPKYTCSYCFCLFSREKRQTYRETKERFCSRTCMYSFWTKSKIVICRNCGLEFEKSASQIARSKNSFCTRSCGVSWNNQNLKKVGIRRSKLELALEEKIKSDLPNIEVFFNNKDQIGSELDILFPEHNTAFEINGPTHYRPIWGEKKLKAIQTLDKQKLDLCQSLSIKLIVLDVSCERFSKENVEKHFQYILKELKMAAPTAKTIQEIVIADWW